MKFRFTYSIFIVLVSIAFISGAAIAESGIGGVEDFNADQKSRIAVIEEAVSVNQDNIADNATDIATLMSSGTGVAPGIANAILQDDQGLPPIPVNTTSVIVTGSINAPVDGYVLAIASLQFSSNGLCDMGVSLSNTLPPYQDVYAPAGNWPATVHGIFLVTAGENLINLLGRSRNDSNCQPNDVNLSLVFFPASSAYGQVTSN